MSQPYELAENAELLQVDDTDSTQNDKFEIPISFLDLSTVIMFTFILITIALSAAERSEYQTKVDLLTNQTTQGSGMGTATMTLTIDEAPDGQCSFVLESKKHGTRKLTSTEEVVKILHLLSPPQLILRIDEETAFKFPQEIIIAANDLGIKIGFAFLQKKLSWNFHRIKETWSQQRFYIPQGVLA